MAPPAHSAQENTSATEIYYHVGGVTGTSGAAETSGIARREKSFILCAMWLPSESFCIAAGRDCDEVLILHEYSKNDLLGQGTDNNIKKCKHDVRLCIPSAFSRLRNMRPAHFGEKNEDAFSSLA